MERKVEETFKELFKANQNNFCFECGLDANEWASVNNGIFLCEKCAVKHTNFGRNVSAVRSIINDTWSSLHLAMMSHGGNEKLKLFFEKYHLPRDSPMDFKYRTKAGCYYREMLRALAENAMLPDTLDPNTALNIEENIDYDGIPDFDIGYETHSPKKESGLEKMYSALEETFDQTVLKTKEVANLIGIRINNPELKQSIKVVGDKITMGAKKGVEEAIEFWRKLSKQDSEQPQVHIQEEKFEVVYSSEGVNGKTPSRKMDKENIGKIIHNPEGH